jgi:hypothetical protein
MPFRLETAVPILTRTPPLLRAWLDGLPAASLDANEGPETFSPRDVVGHLIHGEETDWLPRARRILEHGESLPFEPFDRFAQRGRFTDWTAAALLDRFAALRGESLAALAALPTDSAALARRGMHPALGSVTLGQTLATWVVHDMNHVAQIARVLARQYEGDVGPWIEYLPILRPRSS